MRIDAADIYDDDPPDGRPGIPLDWEIIAKYLQIIDDKYGELKEDQRGRLYYLPQKEALLRYVDMASRPGWLRCADIRPTMRRCLGKRGGMIHVPVGAGKSLRNVVHKKGNGAGDTRDMPPARPRRKCG